MKKLGLERHGTSTFLVYELGPEDTVDNMSLGMLVNNRIPGFAPTIFTQTDNIKQIKCDVTGLVSAEQYLLGAVNKKRLLGVFQGIVRAFSSAEDYMIDTKTIQLELSSIFAHVVTGEAFLICVPVVHEEEQEPDVRAFLKSILFSAQYDAQENQDYVAKIMSYLNGMPIFSLREFRNLLDYLSMEPGRQMEQPPIQSSAMAVDLPAPAEVVKQAPPHVAMTMEGASGDIPVVPAGNKGQAANQISLFYLLQHYNKENAAVYKAQKEEKKIAKKEKKGKKKDGKKTESNPVGQSFAVPGQPEVPKGPEAAATSSVAPVQPAQLIQPTKPPVQPAQPIQPVQPVQPMTPVQLIQPMQPVQPIQPIQAVQAAPPFPVLTAGMGADSKDTVYFSEPGGDETVLMGQDMSAPRLIPYLLRKRNGEKISINKPVFRIGRDSEYNDYAIIENRYIGHSHCHILVRNGEYFLVDDNSKNRTKLNGEVLVAGAEMKLAHGYVIRMADEDFEFHIY